MIKKSVVSVITISMITGCATTTSNPYTGEQQTSNASAGALLGAAAGAIGGLALGNSKSSRINGALIGAGVGALVGGSIGNYMDSQEAELRAQLQGTGVSVSRYGNRIVLNMPSNITFPIDRADINPAFFPTLSSVAIVLAKFDRTMIDVNGHTDSTGSLEHNQWLSQQRANSVAEYLSSRGVEMRRVSAMGFGPNQPIDTNATAIGRQHNRRVEIKIAPINS
ncbi:Outer membrane lipoprotein omp16 precursor [Liberibacter crescens BT-1]|uniref:Outer membrane lipoprotein omp16 n=1 Tax=Liberibacter crescens (strain BT-1) TaxID=1215343 RepID=L0EUY2_LIBCB|nr:OmpA family protein [Liberibacter crescens]AGA64650.1 Outer membrane lipoprotein omp16 precursor [Liberibacter crescens BT-1]AMC12761.1 membrane protein [Liberibacter crescens]